ncbi:MAG: hypothetical protein GY842_13540, partial [bacterium]|nr:hypothetical protein [bacterium]
MPLSWFFHRAACARHDCRLSHVQRARWIILAIYAILISNDTTSANQATPACTHQERPCSPATVARVRALTETAVGEWRARHPALSISPDLSHSLQQAWIAALERRLEPCPSPSTAYQPPPREDCGCLGVPTADTVTTWVKVFGDLDENGQLDPGELGLDDVQVSNGACGDSLPPCTALTEDGGTHTFVTPRHDSRFVFMTVPSGYRATTPFWHRIGAHPDTAYFGLAVEPASADTSFRWVQISDMQVGAEPDEADEHCQDLSEIEQLSSRPAFIVITGDLVMDGDNTPQFENYLTTSDSSCTTIPIHHGYGDHDACTCQTPPCEPVCGPQVYNFEHYVGPSVYSFDYGGIHFVMFNDIHSVNYDPVIPEPGLKQYLWLAEDVITARAQHRDVPIIICKHTMPLAEDLALYAELGGVAAAFKLTERDKGYMHDISADSASSNPILPILEGSTGPVEGWEASDTAPDALLDAVPGILDAPMWGTGTPIPTGNQYAGAGVTVDGETFYLIGGYYG